MYPHLNIEKIFQITSLYTAFREKFSINYDFSGEYHDFWEIVIVLDGEVDITAGSDVFTLKKGRAVLHEPMEFHRIRSFGGSSPSILIFSFAAEGMPEYQSKIFDIADLKEPVKVLNNMREDFLFDNVCVTNIKKEHEISSQITIKELESFILRTISRQSNPKKLKKSRTATNYSTIVNVMEENLEKNLSVSELAELCHMSEVNLKKTFSLYSGMGVMAYFNRLKITTAVNMLKTGMTVQETATALGFANQNYFSTVFKRIIGQPPSYYK